MSESVSARKRSIPRPVISFLVKAIVLFVAWKILYLSFLLPKRILDEPLTRGIGFSTVAVLNGLPGKTLYHGRTIPDTLDVDGGVFRGNVVGIYRNEEKTLTVADACNGLELMALYVGFIICFPAPLKRKLIFGVVGCGLICLLNILRCAALVGIFVHYRSYLDFSHHFAFQIIIYLFIFLLWYIFSKKLKPHERIG